MGYVTLQNVLHYFITKTFSNLYTICTICTVHFLWSKLKLYNLNNVSIISLEDVKMFYFKVNYDPEVIGFVWFTHLALLLKNIPSTRALSHSQLLKAHTHSYLHKLIELCFRIWWWRSNSGFIRNLHKDKDVQGLNHSNQHQFVLTDTYAKQCSLKSFRRRHKALN